MGLTFLCGCVHTEVRVHHHDRGWVPTPNVRWRMVRDALAHAVWLRGNFIVVEEMPVFGCPVGDASDSASCGTISAL